VLIYDPDAVPLAFEVMRLCRGQAAASATIVPVRDVVSLTPPAAASSCNTSLTRDFDKPSVLAMARCPPSMRPPLALSRSTTLPSRRLPGCPPPPPCRVSAFWSLPSLDRTPED
jgi:hypothetical protein